VETNRLNPVGNDRPPPKTFYHLCPECGKECHLLNVWCEHCGADVSGVRVCRSSDGPVDVRQVCLGGPGGCVECGQGCRYCYGYGVAEKSRAPYAASLRCEYCERTRRICCERATRTSGPANPAPEAAAAWRREVWNFTRFYQSRQNGENGVLAGGGADSGHNGLPEPTPDELAEFIDLLRPFTKVHLKSNLKRLLPKGFEGGEK